MTVMQHYCSCDYVRLAEARIDVSSKKPLSIRKVLFENSGEIWSKLCCKALCADQLPYDF